MLVITQLVVLLWAGCVNVVFLRYCLAATVRKIIAHQPMYYVTSTFLKESRNLVLQLYAILNCNGGLNAIVNPLSDVSSGTFERLFLCSEVKLCLDNVDSVWYWMVRSLRIDTLARYVCSFTSVQICFRYFGCGLFSDKGIWDGLRCSILLMSWPAIST